jgi:hypothetical protein
VFFCKEQDACWFLYLKRFRVWIDVIFSFKKSKEKRRKEFISLRLRAIHSVIKRKMKEFIGLL